MKITQKMLLVAAVTFASHSMAQGIVSQELETPAFSKKSSADRVNQANSVYQRINVERANKAPIYNTYNDYQISGDWHQEYDMDQLIHFALYQTARVMFLQIWMRPLLVIRTNSQL